jgi:Spy/CpxP family protein refolding chaperone
MQHREIKALSAQQMEGLRGGKGMAMAMPAELNGYPGPLHVLELTSKLGLSAQQVQQTEKLHAQMLQAAKAQGEKVIAAERELDALFAQKKATAESVSSAVAAAASAQGVLRETHLRYHLAMMDVLTPEQIATYNKLRGY